MMKHVQSLGLPVHSFSLVEHTPESETPSIDVCTVIKEASSGGGWLGEEEGLDTISLTEE